MKYNIKDKPRWRLEAISIIASHYKKGENEIIENCDKFGFTKDQAYSFLDKYITYKTTVLNDILPIFNEKYIMMEPYLIFDDLGDTILIWFVELYDNKLNIDISDADIDEMIIDRLCGMIDDLIGSDENEKHDFTNVSDLIVYLNKAKLANDDKMKIINFYMDRYNLLRLLVALIDEFAPICEKYFYLIQDEFDKSVNYLNNLGDIDKVLKSHVNITYTVDWDTDIFINISFFNQLKVIALDGIGQISIGIHFFDLTEISSKNKYNDGQMVANLKAIADSTRYRIICMLSEKRMYMQEIADKMGLTSANISHHINMLLKYDLISVIIDSVKNKRIYYELNEEKLASLSDSLSNIIKKNK